jgi:hypothetical protein
MLIRMLMPTAGLMMEPILGFCLATTFCPPFQITFCQVIYESLPVFQTWLSILVQPGLLLALRSVPSEPSLIAVLAFLLALRSSCLSLSALSLVSCFLRN